MSTLQDPNPTRALARPGVASRPLSSAPALVTIEAVRPGIWRVRSSDDRFGGTFVCPKSALKFVRDEMARFQRAAMVVMDGVLAVQSKSADRALLTVAAAGFKPAA